MWLLLAGTSILTSASRFLLHLTLTLWQAALCLLWVKHLCMAGIVEFFHLFIQAVAKEML